MALLLALFIIALATMIVFDMGNRARYDQIQSQAFTENIQGSYLLKSGLNLSRALLELPKAPGLNEDWLGEPWALIGGAPQLPIEGIPGEPRVLIVDEDGKLDINEISGNTRRTGDQTGQRTTAEFWRDAALELFARLGFVQESFEREQFRTPGDIGYDAPVMIANLIDAIDTDRRSYSAPEFRGQGIEAGPLQRYFQNRPFYSLDELLHVPGMTLERLARVAPFIRTGDGEGTAQVNVNTAPLEVLLAMGFPEASAVEIAQQRQATPFKNENLATLAFGDNQLRSFLKVTSSEFAIYVRITLPNSVRWLRAAVTISGTMRRRTMLKSVELY